MKNIVVLLLFGISKVTEATATSAAASVNAMSDSVSNAKLDLKEFSR